MTSRELTPEDPADDFGGDPLPEITPQVVEELLRVPGLDAFIEKSYWRFWAKRPDFRGGLIHALFLKIWPTYSQRKYLSTSCPLQTSGGIS